MAAKKKKGGVSEAENIKVLVRCRPLSQKETDAGHKNVVDLLLGDGVVLVNHVVGDPDRWTFDAVINNSLTQADIFTSWISPMIDSVLEGFNATIFAYGQSGSGKTYTMSGVMDQEELIGIIPRAFRYLFRFLKANSGVHKKYNIYCSFMELYNGKVRDLLTNDQKSLQIRENKDKTFFVDELLQPQVKFEEELMRHMEEGTHRRHVAATELNTDSSRSHSVFTVYVQCEETTDDGDARFVTSKLNLVDLAGSERQSKTHASGDTLKEGCNINLSLSALGTVIDTIVKGRGHIPFRSSPLTMLLKDSLGGGSKTCMFANINPSDSNVSETVSTLRFADRAKQIKNKPLVQMDAKDQKIADLTAKLDELKEKLKRFEGSGLQELEKENDELKEKLGDLEVQYHSVKDQVERSGSDAAEKINSAVRSQQDAEKKVEELQELQRGWEREREILEEQIQDGVDQRSELLRLVSDYIADMTPDARLDGALLDMTSIQHYLHKLRVRGSAEVSAASVEEAVQAEKAKWESMLSDALEERRQERTRLQELNTQAQDALQHALQRMEKQKAKIEKEREHRKKLSQENAEAMARTHEGHHSEVERLKGVIDGLESQLKVARRSGGLRGSHDHLDRDSNGFARSQELPDGSCSDAATPQKRHSEDGSHPPPPPPRRPRRSHGDRSSAANDAAVALEQLEEARARAAAAADKHDKELEAVAAGGRQLLDRLHQGESGIQQGTAAAQLQQELAKALGVLESCAGQQRGLQERCDERERKALERQIHLQQRIEELEQEQGGVLPPLSPGADDSPRRAVHADAAEEQLRELSEEREKAAERMAACGSDAALRKEAAALAAAAAAEADALRNKLTLAERREVQLRKHIASQLAPIEDPAGTPGKASSVPSAKSPHKGVSSPRSQQALPQVASAQQLKQAESEMLARAQQSEQKAEELVDELGRASREIEILRQEHESLEAELRRSDTRQAELVQRAEEERSDLQAELESVRRELQDEVRLGSRRNQQQMELVAEIESLRSQATQRRQTEEQLLADLAHLRAELAHSVADRRLHEANAERIEKALAARQQSLEQTRAVLAKQKQLLDDQRTRIRGLEDSLAEKDAARATRELWWQRHLEEQETKLARAHSRRLEELQVRHRGDLRKKDDEMDRHLKRQKKQQMSVQKAKERYDQKVCEYEDLLREFEEHKMRVMERDQQRDRDEVVESKNEIERVIAAAKAAKALQPPRASASHERLYTADARAEEVERRQRTKSAAQRKFNPDGGADTPPDEHFGDSRHGSRRRSKEVDEAEVQQRLEKRSVAARKFSQDSATMGVDARTLRKRVGSSGSEGPIGDHSRQPASRLMGGHNSRTPTPPDDPFAVRALQPRAPFEPKPPEEAGTHDGLWDNPALLARMSEIATQQSSLAQHGSLRMAAGLAAGKLPSPPFDAAAVAASAAAAPRPPFSPASDVVQDGQGFSMGLAPTALAPSGMRRGQDGHEVPNTSMAAILKPSNFLLTPNPPGPAGVSFSAGNGTGLRPGGA